MRKPVSFDSAFGAALFLDRFGLAPGSARRTRTSADLPNDTNATCRQRILARDFLCAQGASADSGMTYYRNHILRTLTRWVILMSLLAAGLFLAAGTTHIPTLRAYLAVFSAMLLLTMLAVDPDLSHERTHPQAGGQDGRSRFGAGFLFLVMVGFAAMDVGRLHQADSVPIPVSIIALAVFAAALELQRWAMIVNPFFSPVIRIQVERGHYVITRGPYRWLRHPGYLAMTIAIPGSALAIGSWLALIPAAGFVLIIVWRARWENELLKDELAGYIDYMHRVPI